MSNTSKLTKKEILSVSNSLLTTIKDCNAELEETLRMFLDLTEEQEIYIADISDEKDPHSKQKDWLFLIASNLSPELNIVYRVDYKFDRNLTDFCIYNNILMTQLKLMVKKVMMDKPKEDNLEE